MRLKIKNGVMTGFSKNRRSINERDILKGNDVPKKLGVIPFARK
jgi:hypothetical protein